MDVHGLMGKASPSVQRQHGTGPSPPDGAG